MIDYAEYEKQREVITTANKKLLAEFEQWLRSSGLSDKTVANHVENIDFYINEFLLYEDILEPRDGVDEVSEFLGYWFIRKAMWASRSSIKAYGASLKKFYAFLLEKGEIEKDELDDLKETIKEGMPEWLATLDRYDDPSVEDVWRI